MPCFNVSVHQALVCSCLWLQAGVCRAVCLLIKLSLYSPPGAAAWRSYSVQAPGEAPPVPPQDDADTHEDFKPKFQPELHSGNIADTIRNDIAQHKVFVYMKVR